VCGDGDYVAVQPTASSDRVCSPNTNLTVLVIDTGSGAAIVVDASSSDHLASEQNSAMGSGVLAVILVLSLLILAVVVGLLYQHHKKKSGRGQLSPVNNLFQNPAYTGGGDNRHLANPLYGGSGNRVGELGDEPTYAAVPATADESSGSQPRPSTAVVDGVLLLPGQRRRSDQPHQPQHLELDPLYDSAPRQGAAGR
jgi:hypothetical protein